ncbi:NADH-ubiquinone reductase complex 1 MLRQ subunit-domain-containing protein [Pilobolus umbonatus]|nr:NADH-ubiquinone reductase complex 1 MLRQ subunit-domain-containing protein [Pilobolus umbonatus]
MGQLAQFLKHSVHKPEVLPLFAILGAALSGGVYMMAHQANAPDVVWNHKANAEPWQKVRDGEQVKLVAYNQKYDKRYHRKEW